MRRTWRVLWNAILGIAATLLLIVSVIQIDQYLFRWRVERLLADIRSLKLRATSHNEAQLILGHWKSAIHYGNGCNEIDCSLDIILDDPINYHLSGIFANHVIHVIAVVDVGKMLFGEYLRLGGRAAGARGFIDIRNGTVLHTAFSAFVQVPQNNGHFPGHEYTLIGGAYSVSHFWPGIPADLFLHPNYSIGGPSGCKPACLMVWAKFTAYADPADVLRLMQFDLSCLTHWLHPCASEGDIMPAAWAQASVEKPQIETAGKEYRTCGPRTLQILGRDRRNAAVVDIVRSFRTSPNSSRELHWDTRANLVERLKGAISWDRGTEREFTISEYALPSGSTESEFHSGSRFILFFDRWTDESPRLEPCGAVPFSASNLASVRAGIEQDYLASDSER